MVWYSMVVGEHMAKRKNVKMNFHTARFDMSALEDRVTSCMV